MNKKVLVMAVVALLLLTGAWYYISAKKSSTSPTAQDSTGNQPSVASSLKDLITKGVAQSCTFDSDGSSGTVYTQGGKVRSDFTTVTGKVSTKSHMIVMDNTSYIWTDGQTTGFKMSFDPNATPIAGASAAPNGSFDANVDMGYKCSTWIADAGKFTLPTGVTFTAFAVPSQAAPAQGSSSSQCSYCDSLTGADKTQCRTALKCN